MGQAGLLALFEVHGEAFANLDPKVWLGILRADPMSPTLVKCLSTVLPLVIINLPQCLPPSSPRRTRGSPFRMPRGSMAMGIPLVGPPTSTEDTATNTTGISRHTKWANSPATMTLSTMITATDHHTLAGQLASGHLGTTNHAQGSLVGLVLSATPPAYPSHDDGLGICRSPRG